MTKILVKPKRSITLFDIYTGETVHHDRATVVTKSSFIQSRVANGDLDVVLNNLPTDYTDADWVKALGKPRDEKKALASLAQAPEPEPVLAPAPTKSRGRRSADEG